MAIAVGTTTSGATSFSHTVAGDDVVLVVVTFSDSNSVASVTYNSVAMTASITKVTTNNEKISFFYLSNPTDGENTVAVTNATRATAINVTGAETVIPPDGTGTASGTQNSGTTKDVSVTTSYDNSIIFCGYLLSTNTDLSGSISVQSGGTQVDKGGVISAYAWGVSYEQKVTAGTEATGWSQSTGSNYYYGLAALAIAEKRLFQYPMTCEVGSFTLTNKDFSVIRGYRMICSVGEFILTGVTIGLNKTRVMLCELGEYTVTFYTANLKRWWTVLQKITSSWSKTSKNTDTWTKKTKNTDTWTKQNKN